MNNTFELIPYKVSANSPSDDTLIASGFIALATLTFAVMQQCGSSDSSHSSHSSHPSHSSYPSHSSHSSQPLRISIPPNIESPPTTPSPPPTRTKNVPTLEEDELDGKILRFLRFNPGATVKEMLKTFKTKDASLTKSDINSRLYKMLIKKMLRKEGDKGVPNWFLI